jgi:hypothetical protein
MKKKFIRVATDILMYVAMSFLAGTGLLIYYRLIPGSSGGRGLTLFGLSRHEWGTYHLWASYLLIFLVVVHLVLNVAFIKNVIAAGKPWIMAVLGLIGLLIILFFLFVPIAQTGEGQGSRFKNRQVSNTRSIRWIEQPPLSQKKSA